MKPTRVNDEVLGTMYNMSVSLKVLMTLEFGVIVQGVVVERGSLLNVTLVEKDAEFGAVFPIYASPKNS